MSTKVHSLYIGTRAIDRDVTAFEGMGARLVWRFQRFGADVAGLRLPDETLIILADHRPEGSVLPLIEVKSLKDPALPQGGRIAETPDGTCRVFELPGGAEIGFIEVTRRNALEGLKSAKST